jgi:hemerythrin-like domain-containing protein
VDAISVWQDDHMRFSRLLDFLEQQMIVSRAGGHPRYGLIGDVIDSLRHFGDRIHHPREDVAFGRLAKRDPGIQLCVNQLSEEHRVIAETGEALLKHLEDIRDDDMIKRVLVEAVLELYVGHYRRHIATEENTVLPRAAKALTPDDWAAVATAGPDMADPSFGGGFDARYQELFEQIAREA